MMAARLAQVWIPATLKSKFMGLHALCGIGHPIAGVALARRASIGERSSGVQISRGILTEARGFGIMPASATMCRARVP
jgi:hypothetical protein